MHSKFECHAVFFWLWRSRFPPRPFSSRRVVCTTMAVFVNFCPKNSPKKISILGTNNWKINKNQSTNVISTFKMDVTKLLFFLWFFHCWYLKLRFVANIFWARIPKSCHCAYVVVHSGTKTYRGETGGHTVCCCPAFAFGRAARAAAKVLRG